MTTRQAISLRKCLGKVQTVDQGYPKTGNRNGSKSKQDLVEYVKPNCKMEAVVQIRELTVTTLYGAITTKSTTSSGFVGGTTAKKRPWKATNECFTSQRSIQQSVIRVFFR